MVGDSRECARSLKAAAGAEVELSACGVVRVQSGQAFVSPEKRSPWREQTKSDRFFSWGG